MNFKRADAIFLSVLTVFIGLMVLILLLLIGFSVWGAVSHGQPDLLIGFGIVFGFIALGALAVSIVYRFIIREKE